MLGAYRVLDLTDERGHVAGSILRQLGAEVIAIEPPGGQSARRMAPFAGDIDDPERSLQHWSYNRGKQSVELDIDAEDGRAELLRLIAGADVLIESFDPGELAARGLTIEGLAELNPALIHVSITPFGSDGPKAGWAATDVTLQASCGNMAITGDKDRAPLRVATLPQAFHVAASEAAAAVLIALHERQNRSGFGQHIDMSVQQSMNQAAQSMMMAFPNRAAQTSRIAGGASLQGIDIQLMWPCKDGHASVTLLFGASFQVFTHNLMSWVCEEGFCDEATRDKDWTEYAMMLLDGREPVAEYERVKDCLTALFATKTKEELLEAAMARRVLITPVWTTSDVVASEQLADRGYWEDIDHATDAHGDLGTVKYPGAFAKFSATPLEVLPPAPTVGADTAAVLAEPDRQPNVRISNPEAATDQPLAGLKVLDLMWVMAGPAASRVLVDYGAEVIRVQSMNKLDAARTLQPFTDNVTDPEFSGLWNNLNAGKREISLDLSKPESFEVIWDLIDWADVVLESFSPKAMKNWGIGYEEISARKPEIVMASSCLMGQTGPLALLAGFGTMAAAISGFFYCAGWPDRAPAGPFGAYTDYTSPRWLVAAILAAVEHQKVTGEGQYIDFSQCESALHLLGPALLEETVNNRVWERDSNRDFVMTPHGVYRSAGDDQWIAIACTSDETWSRLAGEMGVGDMAGLSLTERRQRQDELDDAITAWSSELEGEALMQRLQALGIAAHTVQNSEQMSNDPQLQYRDHFVEVAHATQPNGVTVVEGTRFKLSRTPAEITHGAPTYGEHTFDVLTEILGYDGDRIAELAEAELLE
jgi:crotonobetainyl-CoA:carnitine CoA-transferase CaiB-like acyl-CoA transferase